MGRAFEFRKARKMKRWSAMAKTFTRIGKDIAMAVSEGGQGIVGRLPVYLKNKFWGFSAVIIRTERLLNTSGINSLDKKKFSFQLSKINPITKKKDYFLPKETELTNTNYVSSYIPDGDWKLYLIDKNSNVLFKNFLFNMILGLLLASTFAVFTFLLLKKPEQLQLLIHEQANKLIASEIKFKTIFEQAALGIANIASSLIIFRNNINNISQPNN